MSGKFGGRKIDVMKLGKNECGDEKRSNIVANCLIFIQVLDVKK